VRSLGTLGMTLVSQILPPLRQVQNDNNGIKMKIEIRRYNGTTLIELLVVLFIIALMLGVVSLNYRKSQYRSELKNAASQVRDIIDQTRRYALAPRSTAATGTAGYCYLINSADNSWVIKEYVSTEPESGAFATCNLPLAAIVAQGSFAGSIILSDFSDGYPTYQWTPSIIVDQPISGEARSIVLKHTHLNSDKKINITQEGIINIE